MASTTFAVEAMFQAAEGLKSKRTLEGIAFVSSPGFEAEPGCVSCWPLKIELIWGPSGHLPWVMNLMVIDYPKARVSADGRLYGYVSSSRGFKCSKVPRFQGYRDRRSGRREKH